MTAPVMPMQEDPVAAYKKKYGAPTANQATGDVDLSLPDQAASDPVAVYKAKYGARMAPPSAEPERPGMLSRAATMLGEGAAHAVMHPIDTIESAIAGPMRSAVATLSPGVGEARPDLRLSKGGNSSGRPIAAAPYDAAHGGVTPSERTAGGIQTLANLVTPGTFSAVKSALGGRAVGRIAALAATGAGQGAAQNPQDPGAGAIAGAVATPVGGEIAHGAARGIDATAGVMRRAGATRALVKRIEAAPTLGKTAVATDEATTAANKANYGDVIAEGKDAATRPTPKAVQDVFNDPDVKPFVDRVRGERDFRSADDPTIGREALKRLNAQIRSGREKLARKGEYDADLDSQVRNLRSVARSLKGALSSESVNPAIMDDVAPESHTVAPSHIDGENLFGLPTRVDVPGVEVETPGMRVQTAPPEEVPAMLPSLPHAEMELAKRKSLETITNQAADDALRFGRGSSVKGKLQVVRSPEAALREITGNGTSEFPGRTPGQADAALRGYLGRGKELIKPVKFDRHTTAFGAARDALGRLVNPAPEVQRLAPMVNALDERRGNGVKPRAPLNTTATIDDFLRSLGIVTANDPRRQ